MTTPLSVQDGGQGSIEQAGAETAAGERPGEAELREALERALRQDPPPPFDELAAMVRALTAGRKHTPAEILVRESRDER